MDVLHASTAISKTSPATSLLHVVRQMASVTARLGLEERTAQILFAVRWRMAKIACREMTDTVSVKKAGRG
jgi:hypothetical protein